MSRKASDCMGSEARLDAWIRESYPDLHASVPVAWIDLLRSCLPALDPGDALIDKEHILESCPEYDAHMDALTDREAVEWFLRATAFPRDDMVRGLVRDPHEKGTLIDFFRAVVVPTMAPAPDVHTSA